MLDPTTSKEAAPRGRGVVLGLCIVGALATIAYWALWFGGHRDWLASAHSESYFAFENAFPAADAWLTLSFALAALRLWQRRESAVLWLLTGGSAAIYLGAMDVLFDLENGIYRAGFAAGGDAGGVAIEVAINAFCLIGGAVAVVYGWSNRRLLAGGL